MRKKIFIRVDGSQQLGLGHLVRCIALAQMLQMKFDIHFVSREIPASINEEIEKGGFEFTAIEEENSFFGMLSGTEIVVLDNYYFDKAYQKIIKDLKCKLVCIDDLHDKEFYADLIINQIPHTQASDYKAQFYTQFALGPQYALLRTPFLKQAKKSRRVDHIETVFICFGGSDNKNLTKQTLEVAINEKRFKKIVVVTGVAFNYKEALESIVKRDSRTQHFHAIDERLMLELMSSSDLAIVPASGILLEVIAAGCKVISGMYIDNQRFVFEAYKNAGFFESAEDFSKQYLVKAISGIFDSKYFGGNLVDGYSSQRILKGFQQLAIEDDVILREAKEGDVAKTFEWASNPHVRIYSFNKEAIEFHEHASWFLNKVKNESCYYFIAEKEGDAIGSIRFDVINNSATISYLLDPKFHNQGLGILLLKKGVDFLMVKKIEGIDSIVGFVMPENIASVKAFERLGFIKQIERSSLKFTKSLK